MLLADLRALADEVRQTTVQTAGAWFDPASPCKGARRARPAAVGPPGPTAASRAWREPPGHEHGGEAEQYQCERNRAPPVLPEGTKAMSALTPGPENAEEQENGADYFGNATHSPRLDLGLGASTARSF